MTFKPCPAVAVWVTVNTTSVSAAIVHVAATSTLVEPIGIVQVVVFAPWLTVVISDAPATKVSDRTEAITDERTIASGNLTRSTTPAVGKSSKALQATIAIVGVTILPEPRSELLLMVLIFVPDTRVFCLLLASPEYWLFVALSPVFVPEVLPKTVL